MNNALKGSWVEIENTILTPNERAPQVPQDTKKTPLMMWTRGILIDESAEVGESVVIKTLSGREESGILVDVNPRYDHDFGYPVKELIVTGLSLKEELGGKK